MWGLLVAYDESKNPYTVRHQYLKTEIIVQYNQFGYTDPVDWYCVMVLGDKKPINQSKLAVKSLENAVAFANGNRFKLDDALY